MRQNVRTKAVVLARYTAEEWLFAMLWDAEPSEIRAFVGHVTGHITKYGRGPSGAICGPYCKCHRQWKGRSPKPTQLQIAVTERIYNNDGKR